MQHSISPQIFSEHPTRWLDLLVATAALAFATVARGQIYEFTTLEGDAAFLSRDGVGTVARFQSPQAIAVLRDGTLVVSDTRNNSIRKITPSGVVTTYAGKAGWSNNADGTDSYGSSDGPGPLARFKAPFGVAVDSNGSLFVADTENFTIRKITPDGIVSTFAGAAGAAGHIDGIGALARFDRPLAVAVDQDDNVFVTESLLGTVRKITPTGAVTTIAGTPGIHGSTDGTGHAASFERPAGIVVDRLGNIYVSDSSNGPLFGRAGFNHTIRKISPAGVVTTLAGLAGSSGSVDGVGSAARFNSPGGLALDDSGNVIVADMGNQTIRKISPHGVVTTIAGVAQKIGSIDGTLGEALFYAPTGVAVAPHGSIWVVESANNTVRVISPVGRVDTVAGKPGTLTATSVDGIGAAAQFSLPRRCAVDSSGTLYLTDGPLIRKISPNGSTTTIRVTEQFATLNGICAAPAGNLIATDGSRVIKISTQGVVTVLAGSAFIGYVDDVGSEARFFSADGVATDSQGNIFVADSGNHVIRKISPTGVVSTLAGSASRSPGSSDGAGNSAQFRFPSDVAVDDEGNVFVADTGNALLRKITPTGIVTTVAGLARATGHADGLGVAARFTSAVGLAFGPDGNLFVADRTTIRRVSRAGEVITVAGSPGNQGWDDGEGSAVRLVSSGIAVDRLGNLFVAEANNLTVRKGTPLANPARLVNFSILSEIVSGNDSMTIGIIAGGVGTSGPKPVLIRAVGPSLAAFGSSHPLADPRIEYFSGSKKTAENDNWGGSSALNAAAAEFGAFALGSPTSADAALSLSTLNVGNNSVRIANTGVTGGTVLAEIYDATPRDSLVPTSLRFTNISVLKQLGAGFTAGFVVGGSGVRTLLIRAVGPSLASFGLAGFATDPSLLLLDSQCRQIASNNNWGGSADLDQAFFQTGAFSFVSPASRDSALHVTLPPGAYTIQIHSASPLDNGVVLVEVYEMP